MKLLEIKKDLEVQIKKNNLKKFICKNSYLINFLIVLIIHLLIIFYLNNVFLFNFVNYVKYSVKLYNIEDFIINLDENFILEKNNINEENILNENNLNIEIFLLNINTNYFFDNEFNNSYLNIEEQNNDYIKKDVDIFYDKINDYFLENNIIYTNLLPWLDIRYKIENEFKKIKNLNEYIGIYKIKLFNSPFGIILISNIENEKVLKIINNILTKNKISDKSENVPFIVEFDLIINNK